MKPRYPTGNIGELDQSSSEVEVSDSALRIEVEHSSEADGGLVMAALLTGPDRSVAQPFGQFGIIWPDRAADFSQVVDYFPVLGRTGSEGHLSELRFGQS